MRFLVIFAVAVIISANSTRETMAQDTSCLRQLAPCLNYLNGTRDVPDTCCDPLKSAIRSNPECLCRMISNRGSSRAERAGIDVNEAQQLPARCGKHVNPLACLTGSGGSGDSDQNSATTGLLLQSNWMILVIGLSTIVQIYLMPNTGLA